ncbi:hypothetical protein IFM46972_02128 [Aspergillus udagawae]|uniref:Uncharacterized protein n=1 Tax=Aspergillus udagawae TaxID=91492 RepID=A0A8H3NAP9_9EURO|nr:hypothetical protein IFM46972_02128 [Aspergillus udagawae]
MSEITCGVNLQIAEGFGGSCANCWWHGRSSKCEYYLGRNGQWNFDDDVAILQAGGLRKLLNDGPVFTDMPPTEVADDPSDHQSVESDRTPRKSIAAPPSPGVAPEAPSAADTGRVRPIRFFCRTLDIGIVYKLQDISAAWNRQDKNC